MYICGAWRTGRRLPARVADGTGSAAITRAPVVPDDSGSYVFQLWHVCVPLFTSAYPAACLLNVLLATFLTFHLSCILLGASIFFEKYQINEHKHRLLLLHYRAAAHLDPDAGSGGFSK